MPVAHVNGGAIIPSLGLGKLFNNNQYVTLAIPLAILIAVVAPASCWKRRAWAMS